MKPYGYTGYGKSKKWDYAYEDVLAIQIAGRKSSCGKFPEKCGVYKSYTRSTSKRKYCRRYFKKAFRQFLKLNNLRNKYDEDDDHDYSPNELANLAESHKAKHDQIINSNLEREDSIENWQKRNIEWAQECLRQQRSRR